MVAPGPGLAAIGAKEDPVSVALNTPAPAARAAPLNNQFWLPSRVVSLGGMPDNAPEADAREFAAQFRSFLDWIHATNREERSEVSTLVGGFLGPDGAAQSVVTRELAPFEHVNLQTALDAWSVRPGRTVEVRGLTLPPHHSIPSLQQLVAGDDNGMQLTPPALNDLPNGPGSTLGCLKLALLLVTEPDRRFIVMVRGPAEHDPGLEVDVAGLPVDAAQRVLAELDELRSELNVYRGHLLEVALTHERGQPRLRRAVRAQPRRRGAAGRRARPDRAARARGGRSPRGAARRRAAPQARPAAVRAARHRQDAHHPLPARPDDLLHAGW